MRKRKILSYLLSFTLMMTSMPTQLFAAQVDTQSNETYIDLEQQTTTESVIKVGQPHEYSGDGFNVSFEITDQWAGAFNANMTILNTGKKALENWTLSFDFDHEITNIWGAQIVSHEGNTYVIKNATYNQDIAVGDSVTVGFSAMGDEIKAPSSFNMLISEEQVANEDYTIGFKVTSDWGSAFNGEISIKNNTEKDIEDWILEFDYDREINTFWTASIEEHEGKHYVVKNAGYNANIKAGETLILGFAGTPGNVNDEPQNYILSQIG